MANMMAYRGYHAQIEYDAEDALFVGRVFGIPDSLNFHGASVQELEEMFHQSIDNYLTMCAECGKEPDEECKENFNIIISPELHKKISLHALQKGITIDQYVVMALENATHSV